MQRRTGKGLAHISISPSPGLAGFPDSEKTPSRLRQKSLGVTNRIWLILLAFVALVVFTRSVLPQESPHARQRIPHSDLKPKNYLNFSEDAPNPFPFCPALGPNDDLATKYDPIVLSTTRFHLGSGARIQRVINKALSGLPVTISVVGGSVSACHGAGDDPLSPTCWPARFFNWWNAVFPHPATELTNGAMRRTSSAYFSFCNAHHIPDLTDLVIIELDVDDANMDTSTEQFEILIRSILLRPDSPAVLILGHFSPQVAMTRGFAGADHGHSLVAQFYDIPHISTKPILHPKYMSDPSSVNQYFADPVLANPAGHEVLADVLISYLQSQVCTTWAAITGHSAEVLPSPAAPVYPDGQAKQPTDARGLFGGVADRKGAAGAAPPEKGQIDRAAFAALPVQNNADRERTPNPDPRLRVPAMRIDSLPMDLETRPFEEVAPYCVSANDLVNPLPLSMFQGSGWAAFHPPAGAAELSSHAHYFYSALPTSRLRVNIQIGAGDVAVYYVKEPARDVGEGSAIECQVDDNYAGAVIIKNAGDVGEATPTLHIIDRHVPRGSHYVECQLLGDEDDRNVPPFKIIGIFST
ncbi:hypothetical protein GSI_09181 [Ganoderma sinense ZZ0214-1]|uniref:Capsular associated protein n=1 Tax=Ganoderma sinense ZZ0214-1 TaxID=1077348 RepID=A0A2G8S5S8_9APHY|nr:hypothetical protein GSI_09181 [Ganoderma sinense ZZ0214-1]